MTTATTGWSGLAASASSSPSPYRGDEVFELLEQRLGARYPDVRFVGWREFGSTHGSEERAVLASLPQRFKELGVDAAISGMGC